MCGIAEAKLAGLRPLKTWSEAYHCYIVYNVHAMKDIISEIVKLRLTMPRAHPACNISVGPYRQML
eukprot:scaffold56684_cov15-Prasinocladus_malaysianus.AAC.1